ncbi:hypothetical protein KRP22_003879 [Phytophthora ramorum]|nr:hypothetical protein KRP22_9812 [Phytophthora ramorum]
MDGFVKDSTATSDVDADPRPGSKRKLARKSLTLREKSIAKSFCEQKVNDCKTRGELAPSQELLRREVATQFGWSVGRSTLSKIISMDWKLLRGGQEGGDAPRNPDMKRRRRPLFPAFEADLVKFITAHLGEDEGNGSVTDAGGEAQSSNTGGVSNAVNGERRSAPQPSGGGQGRVLTEALILEEAQRLKQVHSVSDDKLVLSTAIISRM